VGETLASVAEYRPTDGTLDFHHTETYADFRGRGLAERLVRWALDDVGSRSQRVVSTCSFVTAFIDAHLEYQHLLADTTA
jgi:hypothetical protein